MYTAKCCDWWLHSVDGCVFAYLFKANVLCSVNMCTVNVCALNGVHHYRAMVSVKIVVVVVGGEVTTEVVIVTVKVVKMMSSSKSRCNSMRQEGKCKQS